jgi:hypothetical protein
MQFSLALSLPRALPWVAFVAVIAVVLLAACTSDAPSTADGGTEPSQGTDGPDPGNDGTPESAPEEPDPDTTESPETPPADEPGDEPPPSDDPATDVDDPTIEPGDPDGNVDPAPEEPDEPEVDPWESRRRDLLIELTDDVDVDLLREFGQIVGERRGLPLLQDVPAFLIRRDDVDDYFTALYSEEDLLDAEFTEATYRLLRIIGDDVNYSDLLQDLFVGLVLGFYDEDVASFIIVSDDDHITRRDLDTISHEFVHALQDQHFGLNAAFEATLDETDAEIALRFILEGDARLSEALFSDVVAQFAVNLGGTSDRLPGAGGVPPLLRLIFNAPYLDGLNAVTQIVLNNGPNAVDLHIATPPASTEQVLHPEKLATGELPIAVPDPDIADALGGDWALQGTDTLGEYVIRSLLAATIGAGNGIRAAAGWGGDRLTVYNAEDAREVLVWEVAWDDFNEALEFAGAIEEWANAQLGGRARRNEDTSYSLNGGDGAAWTITVDTSVWVVIGTDDAVVETAADAVRDLVLIGGFS